MHQTCYDCTCKPRRWSARRLLPLLMMLIGFSVAQAGMSGTYTIGTSGSENYSSISSAISALGSNGVSGPVVFEISSGSYSTSSPFYLRPVSGMSSTNTVTFKPASGATVSISGSVSYNGIFRIDGGDYYIIDGNSGTASNVVRGLTITNTYGSSYCAAIFITNSATHNVIRNAKIISNNYRYISSSSGGGVVFIGSYYGGTGSDYNVIHNNIIGDPGGTYHSPGGVVVYGNSSYKNDYNEITDNQIVNTGQRTTSYYSSSCYSIKLEYAPHTLVRGNEIYMNRRANNYYNYGIYVYNYRGYSEGTVVDANSIHDIQGYQPYGYEYLYALYYYSYGDANDDITISNNMVSTERSGQYLYGLYLGSMYYNMTTTTITIANNSFHATGIRNLNGGIYGYSYSSGNPTLNILNNIFDVSAGGYLAYLSYSSNSYAPTINSDHNLYNVSGGARWRYHNSYYSSLSSLRSGQGQELHSVTGAPHFIDASNGDLHIDPVPVSKVDGLAVPLDSVPTDFDGQVRDPNYPDIGADEGWFNGGGITVTMPNGGENVIVDYDAPIRFNLTRPIPVTIDLSLDNGTTWTNYGTFSSTVQGSNTVRIHTPNIESSQCLVKITNAMNSNEVDMSNRVFNLVRPVINVAFPNGGESVVPTDTVQVTWTSRYIPSDMYLHIDYSIDGGATWNVINPSVNSANLPAINATDWIVPATPTTHALIRAMVVGSTTIGDMSDAEFTILPTPRVTVTSPNGGEGIYANSTYDITWTSVTTDNVKLQYTTDDGATWNNALQGGIPMVPTYLGSYPWKVPDVETNQARVRVINAERPRFSDESDADFSILKTDLAVLTPTSGSSYGLSQPVTVTWASRNVMTLKIEYSSNNGTTWITESPSTSASAGSFTFTPPAVPTTTARVRVTSLDRPDLSGLSGLFEIAESPTVMIFSPVAGDKLIAGSTHQISFEAHGISNVDIRYSSDGGLSWTTIVSNVPSWRGVYDWQVPSRYTTKGKIRIQQTGGSIMAESGIFSIVAAPRPLVQVISPNGGESYTEGDPVELRWFARDVDLVTLSYTSDDGATWTKIASNIPASSSSYSWQAPMSPSTAYRVRVSNPSSTDISDSTFEVKRQLHPSLTVIYPNGGESFLEGTQ